MGLSSTFGGLGADAVIDGDGGWAALLSDGGSWFVEAGEVPSVSWTVDGQDDESDVARVVRLADSTQWLGTTFGAQSAWHARRIGQNGLFYPELLVEDAEPIAA
jgi:hypothetical protein